LVKYRVYCCIESDVDETVATSVWGVNTLSNNKPKKEITETMKKDYVTNKLLLVFTFAFALLLLFANIGRMMKNNTTFMAGWNLAKIFTGVAIVAFVVGIVMMIVERAKKRDVKYRLLSGKNVAIVSAVCAISGAALSLIFSPDMLMLLYVFIPALVVLYIIYYSYPREFFMIALSSIVSGAGIWLLISDLVNAGDMVVLAIAAVVVAALLIFTIVAQIRKGKLMLFGREVSFFKSDAKYALLYLTYVLCLLLIAAAFLAADLALYFIFGLVAYILITGIYYTVKLI